MTTATRPRRATEVEVVVIGDLGVVSLPVPTRAAVVSSGPPGAGSTSFPIPAETSHADDLRAGSSRRRPVFFSLNPDLFLLLLGTPFARGRGTGGRAAESRSLRCDHLSSGS